MYLHIDFYYREFYNLKKEIDALCAALRLRESKKLSIYYLPIYNSPFIDMIDKPPKQCF